MLPFAYYLLKVIICSAMLFSYYWFLLRNKVFHAYNRFYLLAAVVLSFSLPLIKFNIFHNNANKPTVIKMLQVVAAGDEYMNGIIIEAPVKSHFNLINAVPFLYVIVSLFFLIMLIQLLVSIFLLLRKNQQQVVENIYFINTDAAKGTPFSFFKYIFWNRQIDINSPAGIRIFKHEIAHVQQRHSWDKIFINVVLIFFWSNPIFWLIRKELSIIHEFIADKHAVEDGDTSAFAAMILQATYPQKNFFITNNFFYSPIKRRLLMLTKNQHPRMNYISRLLVLPLLVIVFGAFTIKIADKIGSELVAGKAANKIVVVLDAGHGGQDAGAINKNGITEKDLALQLVKKIKAVNKDQNIEIILTRNDDVFADPRAKAEFAKNNHADLFVSIHLDNTPKEKWNTVSGMNVFVAKEGIDNVEKSKRLAEIIINSFKNNFGLAVPTTVSQRQNGIYVLQANSFPSVIIEAGYLTNDKDAAYLLSEKGQETFAKNILNAIGKYASNYSKTTAKDLQQKLINDTLYYFNGKQVKKSDLETMMVYNKLDVKLYKPADAATKFKTRNNESVVEIFGRNEDDKGRKDEKLSIDVTHLNAKEKLLDEVVANTTDKKNKIDFADVMNNVPDALYVIDGKISSKNAMQKISSIEIDRINVLKGKPAENLYGEAGKNGVIEVFTKKIISNHEVLIPTLEGNKGSVQPPAKAIFTKAEVDPEFPGGKDAWKKFLEKNLDGSIASKQNLKDGSYVFVTKFIVHEDGSLSDFTSEENINDTIAKYCIDVIKKGPKWKPAIQNGYIVSAYKKQPITFVVASE